MYTYVKKVEMPTLNDFISGCLITNSGHIYHIIDVKNPNINFGEVILEYHENYGSYLTITSVYENKDGNQWHYKFEKDVTELIEYLEYSKLVYSCVAQAIENIKFMSDIKVNPL
ncbi:MAG: hypothetical protein EBS04_07615 [Chitinophagia bacterium]|jgi:hypothetical protein|nr:hypothetical protein [Chitinophagia bacterium]